MQNRHSFKHIPSTPNFIVPDGTAQFDHLPVPSPVSTLPPPSGPAPALSAHASSGSLAPGQPPSPDYFTSSVSDKYPPVRGAAGPAAGRSSVHVPLLARDTDDDDMADTPYHSLPRPGGGGPGGGGRAAGGILGGLLHSRLRLHPLALVPALMVGVVLALSGIFGPTLGTSRSNMVIAPLSRAPAHDSDTHNYTLHKSGHLFVFPSALHPSSDSSPYSALEASRPQLAHTMRHPIHDLISNATTEWDKKLKRQSKTLEQAVREYKRRHRRPPPKGFDDWFRFAQANKVILIDEFDQTFTDILPFWALSPKTLATRQTEQQVDPTTFTMVINKGAVEIVGSHAQDGRAKDQAELMKRWTKWVPDVNITMSAHDGPSIMMEHGVREKHVEMAKKGKLLSDSEAAETGEDAALWGFPLTCPANSRLRRAYDGLEIDTLPRGPSFVANHLETMDLCANPEWQYLHGFTSWPGMRPLLLRPLFSFAKTTMHSDVLLTPLEQYWDHEPWDPEWDKKQHAKAVWRGSTTGVWFDRGTWWRSSQRVRLWFMGKDKTGTRRVRFSGEGLETARGVESLVEKRVATQQLMDHYVDFAFTGREGQCDVDDGSCAAVKKLFDFQRTFGWNEANDYKYLLDLDGNAWSGRFHRLLSSNSAVIKSTIFPEWYAGWIQPWVHYIPLKVDYTDLFDIMAFFAGDLDGRNAHDDLAKQIADNGKDYATRFWRYEDMEAYFFRLALEWARVSSPDRRSMDYQGPGA